MRHSTNAQMRAYSKTIKGYLVKTYGNMKARVSGQNKRAPHIYKGLPIEPRQDFYEWALFWSSYPTLFQEWKLSGYHRDLQPSINRINSKCGYTFNNMEWKLLKENCRDGGRQGGKVSTHYSHDKHSMAKLTSAQVTDMRTDKTNGYSYGQIARHYNISRSQAFRICTNKSWQEAKK